MESEPLLKDENLGCNSSDCTRNIGKSKEEKSSNLAEFIRGLDWRFWSWIFIFTLLGFGTRYYEIAAGDFVVWDEAHFGKFGSYYLKREFYFDVHPNLGKMLIGLGGWLSGYNGTFSFDSGAKYPEWVNYVGMRMFVASFGALVVPLAYAIAVQIGLSPCASILVGFSCAFDNGFIGISRLILLDPILLFFTAATVLGLASFLRSPPFTRSWIFSLAATGLCIGCVLSVKWVGLFSTALVGFHTIEDLWNLLGDLSLPKKKFLKHLSARVLFLISIPMSLYIFFFFLHFSILNRSGPGDANMSSLFQASLIGNEISKSPILVAYNSVLTLRNQEYGGALLHSHVQVYPSGSGQQQVTGYHHKDVNNDWRLMPVHGKNVKDWDTQPIEYLANEHVVRLVHVATGKNLHAHAIAAAMSQSDYEVSGYADDSGSGDPNDHWAVEVVHDRMGLDELGRVRSLSTVFRLRHVMTGCYLSSSKKLLPSWGFGQMEVSCSRKDPKSSGRDILWNIESQVNPRLPPGNSTLYRSRFIEDFIECNIGMWRTNNALKQDPDLEPACIVSEAKDWPLMLKGIRMNGWGDDNVKFYMLGNPIVWWSGIASVVIICLILLVYACLQQRGTFGSESCDYLSVKKLVYQAKIAVGGWMLHYLPFFLMGRVLYVHHYYPCLFFSILAWGSLLDYTYTMLHLKSRSRAFITVMICISIGVVFWLFSPLCYGIYGPAVEKLAHLNWVSSWKLY